MDNDKPDLRTIDFTIEEVPGKFITNPTVAAAIGIDIDNGPGVYVCSQCEKTIEPKALMYLDFTEGPKGLLWRHLKPCENIRQLAKKRVAAAYTIAKTLLPNATAEEQFQAAAQKLATTSGIDTLRAELIQLRDMNVPAWWKGDADGWKKYLETL